MPRGAKRKYFPRPCAWCGTEFDPSSSHQPATRKYCDHHCAASARNSLSAARPSDGKQRKYLCACGCKQTVLRYPSRIQGPRVFLSREHYLNWRASPLFEPRKHKGRLALAKPLQPSKRAPGRLWVGMLKTLQQS